jgi:hypothetical protein
MDEKLKIITQLPLRELWRDNGFKASSRGRRLTADDITGLLRAGAVQFVVADGGSPPRWISLGDCYRFWKEEVKSHLAAGDRARLDDFPGCYFYFASEWDGGVEGPAIVLLEKYH